MFFDSHNEQELTESDSEQQPGSSIMLENFSDDELVSDMNISTCSAGLPDACSVLNKCADSSSLPYASTAHSNNCEQNHEQQNCVSTVQVGSLLPDVEPDSHRTVCDLYNESHSSDDECDHTLSTLVNEHDDEYVICSPQLTSTDMSPVNLMLLLLKLKHNLTKDATQDIAKLLNVVSNKMVASTSMHRLLKDFVTGKHNVEVHHYCKNCGSYVGIVVVDDICCSNSACATRISQQDSLDGGHFFFYMPLAQQLIDLFENHSISHLAKHSPTEDNLCDITNGVKYKKLLCSLPDSSANYNLTLTFNCDGVPVFKSSSFSIWPILCAVNELPPNIRGAHILLASLWFGAGKPDMNVLLEPFIKDCTSLSGKGFSHLNAERSARIFCTATVAVGVCDAVARPMMQNFKQYNGHYGCGMCLNPGEIVEKGNGRTRVYLMKEDVMLRTIENTRVFVSEAMETENACMGVKGPSLLSLLPHFDLICRMVPDYMHCICLGVVRQMANLWFDSKNHEKPFYIGTHIPSIDAQLLIIKPPCSISRTPRSVSLTKFWKAHEWLAWLLYYSMPVLKNILPVAYYSHWSLVVACTAILLGNDISLAQLVYCERSFVQFVTEFDQLYGRQHMSYNVHQLLHITLSVRDWGPLWAHSAFMFESFNAELLKTIKGTQGVPKQILSTFCLTRAIPYNVGAVLPNCSQSEAMFIQSLTSHRHSIQDALRMSNGVTVLGKPVVKMLQRSHFVALHSVTAAVSQTCVAYYNRVVHKGEILHSHKYCRDLKRNSYTVRIVDDAYYQIETFVAADIGSGHNCYALGRYLRQVPFHFCNRSSLLKSVHIVPVSKVPSALVAIPVTDIIRKCVFISLNSCDVSFVCNQVHINDLCA